MPAWRARRGTRGDERETSTRGLGDARPCARHAAVPGFGLRPQRRPATTSRPAAASRRGVGRPRRLARDPLVDALLAGLRLLGCAVAAAASRARRQDRAAVARLAADRDDPLRGGALRATGRGSHARIGLRVQPDLLLGLPQLRFRLDRLRRLASAGEKARDRLRVVLACRSGFLRRGDRPLLRARSVVRRRGALSRHRRLARAPAVERTAVACGRRAARDRDRRRLVRLLSRLRRRPGADLEHPSVGEAAPGLFRAGQPRRPPRPARGRDSRRLGALDRRRARCESAAEVVGVRAAPPRIRVSPRRLLPRAPERLRQRHPVQRPLAAVRLDPPASRGRRPSLTAWLAAASLPLFSSLLSCSLPPPHGCDSSGWS